METKTVLIDYIQREFAKSRKAAINTSEDLLSNGILDSLAILQLVTFIEKRFLRSIPVEDIVYENFCSVDAMTGYLQTTE